MNNDNLTVEPTVEPKVEPVVESVVEPITDPVKSKNDLLREISKDNGINLFDVEGLKKFKEYQDSQKSELEKANELIDSYKTKETEWSNKENEFNSKLKASELGIPQEKLADALRLADGDPSKLADVIKKYPTFVAKEGIKIGVTNPNNNTNPDGLSEAEQYMAKNPTLYKK